MSLLILNACFASLHCKELICEMDSLQKGILHDLSCFLYIFLLTLIIQLINTCLYETGCCIKIKWTFHAAVLPSLIFLLFCIFYIQVLSESNSNLRTPRTILEQKQSSLGMYIQLKFSFMLADFHLPVVLHSLHS